jgi:hypothetical protein
MRRILRTLAFVVPALLLVACKPSATDAPATAPDEPASTAPAATAHTAAPAAPVAESASLPPVGTCGDQSGVAEDQRIANTVRWTTASEQDNFGYDVYRGDSGKGPFNKLNSEPIGGAGTTDTSHDYEYRDDTIDPCKEYWYYVESISTSGRHEKFTPTFQAKPKRRAADAGEAAEPAPAAEPAAG